jgi:hypothetical protein
MKIEEDEGRCRKRVGGWEVEEDGGRKRKMGEDGERWRRWMKIDEDGGRCRKRGDRGRWR